MAECKDCIHFCVCSPYTAPNESYPEVDGCKCFRATADVVPKSDADEIAEELSDTIVMKDELFDEVIKLRGELANAKAKVAREIFEEIDEIMANIEIYVSDRERTNFEIGAYKCHASISLKIAELKKKYTGESDVKRDTV